LGSGHFNGPDYPFTNKSAMVVSSVKHPSDITRALDKLKSKNVPNVTPNVSKIADEKKTVSSCTLKASGFCKEEYCSLEHPGCIQTDGVWRPVVVLPRPALVAGQELEKVKDKKVGKNNKKKQVAGEAAVLTSLVNEANSANLRSRKCPFNPCSIKGCVMEHEFVVVEEKKNQELTLDALNEQINEPVAIDEAFVSGTVDNFRTNGVFGLYCKVGLTPNRNTDAIGQSWMGPHRLETVAHLFWDVNSVPRASNFGDYYILGKDGTIHYVIPESVRRYKLPNTDLIDDYASFEVDGPYMKELQSQVRYSLSVPRVGSGYVMVVSHPVRGVLSLPLEFSKADKRMLFSYSVDTLPGYSGAPILERVSGKVVARHKGAVSNSKFNCGIGHNSVIISMCGTVSSQVATLLPKN